MNEKRFSEFNRTLLEKVIMILNYVSVYEGVTLYQYDFEEQKKIKIVISKADGSVISRSNSCEQMGADETFNDDNYVKYYWIEFIKRTGLGNSRYKISLFDKDFDRGSGYVHVLPGYIQIWKYSPDEAEEFTLSNVCKKGISGIVRFAEGNWDPMICGAKYYYSVFDFESDDKIKELIESVTGAKKKESWPSPTGHVKYLENENLFRGSLKKVNNRTNRYAFMHWYQENGRDFFWTPYNTFFDKNGYCWTKYGEVQFWSHEKRKGKRKTTHDFVENDGWILHYPYTDGEDNVAAEKNPVQSILTKSYDPDRHEHSPGIDIWRNHKEIEDSFHKYQQ